jgi:LysR family transcriptional regulator, glycine cleavage system transcriptional activator
MSLPLVRLHSLDFVRGFVAVGRRMSITLAAEDLCLTQSAVSRQIHSLEAAMGLKLLHRGFRSISFTAEGERLFRAADIAMQQLQDVMGALDTRNERRPVTVTASIGVAGLWLLPRLANLHRKFPGIDVRVAANNKVLDLEHDRVDIAIRYCAGGTEPKGATRLFGEELIPVAHPSLGLADLPPKKAVAQNLLLEFDEARRPWLQWPDQLAALGLGSTRPKGVLRFNQYDQVIYAAIAGQGIALGRRALVEDMLRDGRLTELRWGDRLSMPTYAYWLILATDQPREDVLGVAQWIEEEATQD